ncbi:hypothetical protein A9Q81_20705 [Gammaproteobacteria bacterium 42_54_T18]|nr:hypothetical protein A9Q81_20705 [Gammaproteobacteria bacterium 42_54_T18]
MRFSEKLLLAKIETIYGVDASPGATNAILAKDVELTPLEAEALERGLVKPHLGADESIISGEHVLISFKVEYQGSGTPGTAPAWNPLVRACGFAETITAATSVEYDLAANNYESTTIYFNMGKNLHAMKGTRGNVKLTLEKGIPYLEFNFIGLWVDPTEVAPVIPDWTAWQKPTPTGAGRTSGFTLNGFAAKPYKLSLDVGQDVKFIETLTTQSIDINERKASGSISIEAPDLSVKDFFSDAKNSVTGALSIQNGQVAGLICKVDCPKVQVKPPKYGDNEGTASLDMDLILIPSAAGNDEIKFTLT